MEIKSTLKSIILMSFLFNGCKESNNTQKVRAEQKEGFSEITISKGDSSKVILDLSKDSVLFLPVLRNFEPDDWYSNLVVNQSIGDNLAVFVAKVQKRKNGKTGIEYVMKQHVSEYKISEAEIISIATRNLKNAKLKLSTIDDEDSKKSLISVESELGLATTILSDNSFYDKACKILKAKKLNVAIINSGSVIVTTPNSVFHQKFKSIANSMDYNDVVHIYSALYEWDNHQFKMLEKFK